MPGKTTESESSNRRFFIFQADGFQTSGGTSQRLSLPGIRSNHRNKGHKRRDLRQCLMIGRCASLPRHLLGRSRLCQDAPLVYVSSAVELFSEGELEDLLSKSRQNNAAVGLTGMLLYKAGNFMQCLEGPKETVCTLMTRIKSDHRHRGVIVLLHGESDQPEFNEWAMGFKKLESNTALKFPGYSDFLDLPLTSEEFRMHPSMSLKLLLNFKRDMR